jgi:hypothetical protein
MTNNHPNRDMPRWTCEGFRPVRAETASEAAAIFANRLAVRQYGKRGYMRTCRLHSWTESGREHTFEVFIGYSVGGGTTSGHNEWLHVYAAN